MYRPPAPQPANIFLDCDHNAKLGDIGLAAQHDASSGGSSSSSFTARTGGGGGEGGEAVGTWNYLAPEYKGLGGGRSSVRTDTYAFGLTLLQVRGRGEVCVCVWGIDHSLHEPSPAGQQGRSQWEPFSPLPLPLPLPPFLPCRSCSLLRTAPRS